MIDLGLCCDSQECPHKYTRATCPRAKIEATVIAGLPLAFRTRALHADRRDLWTELACRCHLSRRFTKQAAYEALWGLGDPWVRSIILAEMADILR